MCDSIFQNSKVNKIHNSNIYTYKKNLELKSMVYSMLKQFMIQNKINAYENFIVKRIEIDP